jgi:ketosteroid isomerase-like protein
MNLCTKVELTFFKAVPSPIPKPLAAMLLTIIIFVRYQKKALVILIKMNFMFRVSKFIRTVILLVSLFIMFTSCNNKKNYAELKSEIKQIEKDLQKLLISEGAASAFYKFAADNAVIKRENDTLIFGKEEIKKYYTNPFYKNAVAIWEPDYIDISNDQTMAYTFGKYEWTFIDSTGKKTNYKGIFHTVWKKMSDGSWKYVWD